MKSTIKCALCTIFAASLAFTVSPRDAFAADYNSHWAKAQIDRLIEKGIVAPEPNTGNTNPDRILNRAEMARLINQATGQGVEGTTHEYPDVPQDAWFAKDIGIAASRGILVGYQDGTMRPEGHITRQEAAVIITRLLGLADDEVASDRFTDSAQTGSWARGSVGAAVTAGVMSGNPDGSFRPGANMSRAEAFTVIDRLLTENAGQLEQPQLDTVEIGESGIFGKEDETTAIGNAVITREGVRLLNVVVSGDLTVAESVGEGEVILEGVEVAGKTYVKGGGSSSVHIMDSSVQKSVHSDMIIIKDGVTISLESGEIGQITFESSGRLDVSEGGKAGTAFIGTTGQVNISGSIDAVTLQSAGANLALTDAHVGKLTVMSGAEGSNINIGKGSTVETAVANASSSFRGEGEIKEMEANSKDVITEKVPETQTGTDTSSISDGTSSEDNASTAATAENVRFSITTSGSGCDFYKSNIINDPAIPNSYANLYYVGTELQGGAMSIIADISAVNRKAYDVKFEKIAGGYMSSSYDVTGDGVVTIAGTAFAADTAYNDHQDEPQIKMTIYDKRAGNDANTAEYGLYLFAVARHDVVLNGPLNSGTVEIGGDVFPPKANSISLFGTSGPSYPISITATPTMGHEFSQLLVEKSTNGGVDWTTLVTSDIPSYSITPSESARYRTTATFITQIQADDESGALRSARRAAVAK